MNNEIILRSVYGKVAQTYFIQPCPDPRTGRLPNCVRNVKGPVDNTEMILSEDDVDQMNSGAKHFVPADKVFEIVDGSVFNLDDIVDKAHWESIKFCNWIAKDRYERDAKGELVIDGGEKRYGIADLYVERPGEITKVKISKKQLVHRACAYVYEDKPTERVKKAKVLGRNLATAMEADVIDYLVDIAEKKPKKIIDLYEGEDWKMQLFILDAIDRGGIRKSENIYKYDDKMLGGTIEATVTFLRDLRFKKLLESIKRETYPEMLPKDVIQELKNTDTSGIPHYDTAEELPIKKLTPAEKAAATRQKNKLK